MSDVFISYSRKDITPTSTFLIVKTIIINLVFNTNSIFLRVRYNIN